MTKSRAVAAKSMVKAVPPLKIVPPEPDAKLVARQLRQAAKQLIDAASQVESWHYLPPSEGREPAETMPQALARHGERGAELLSALEGTRSAQLTLEDAAGGLFALLRERDSVTNLRMATLVQIGQVWRSKRTGEATASGNMARELAKWGLIDPDDRDAYTPSRTVMLAAAPKGNEEATASDGA